MKKTIERLQKLEAKAREIRNRLDDVELKWSEVYEKARSNKAEWSEFCKATGCCDSYNFGDVIC